MLRAAFHAQVLVNILQRSFLQSKSFGIAPIAVNLRNTFSQSRCQKSYRPDSGIEAAVRESCKNVSGLYEAFKYQAITQGWVMAESLLNPGTARLCS